MPRPTPLALALLALVVAVGLGLRTPLAGAIGEARVFLPAVTCPGCAGAVVQPSPTPVDAGAFESCMVQLVNAARAAAGCPAAAPNPILMSAAREWSIHMDTAGDYRHAPSSYYTDRGYPTNAVLENIAGGSDVPEYVFQGWMGSPAHRGNIEWCYHPDDPSYTPNRLYEIGVGYSDGYWTLAIGDRAP